MLDAILVVDTFVMILEIACQWKSFNPIPCGPFFQRIACGGGGSDLTTPGNPFPNRQFLAQNDVIYIKIHLRVKRNRLKHTFDPSDHVRAPSEKFEKNSPKKTSDHAGGGGQI